ncbi:ABC transporter permease [Pseudofrankia sp. DC12]|uniref:ABC transporter permease n=1 Tax=Pseudofrankia sp. DC12 TaxID=683315 RepID=UPI0005F78454|nr:ABC transporter permease [Pseudofrankia sp. DC12]
MTTLTAPPVSVLARLGKVRLGARPGTLVASLILLFALIAVVAPGLLTHGSPTAIDLRHPLGAPSWHHPFGTDDSGRDLYTRVVYGARESFGIGLGATGLAMAAAVLLGFAAGLAGGAVDVVISRVLEVAFAFPVLLLALLLISIFGPSLTTELVAVGIGSAPGYARMVRGQVRSVRQAGYVEAAGALGHSRWAVIRQHLFPNAMRPLVAVLTLGIGQSIVWASGLAFLGLGVAPPSPEWGALLDAGRLYITTSWWLEVLPGLVIVLVTLAVTSLGRTLQRRLEGAAR